MPTPEENAEELHHLVEDLNAGQMAAGRDTTIGQPKDDN